MNAPHFPQAPLTGRTIQIQDSHGNTLDCEYVNQFTVNTENYLILSPTALEVCLFFINDENSISIVEQSDKSYERLLLRAQCRLEKINLEQQYNPKIAIKRFGPSLFAAGLAEQLVEDLEPAISDSIENLDEDEELFGPSLFAAGLAEQLVEDLEPAISDSIENLDEDEELFELAFSFWYFSDQISQLCGLYYKEPDLYVAKYSSLALVEGEELERIRSNAVAAYRATLSTADGDSPITP
jgi:hypothetical protein